jgi:hypothetical protein
VVVETFKIPFIVYLYRIHLSFNRKAYFILFFNTSLRFLIDSVAPASKLDNAALLELLKEGKGEVVPELFR